MHTMTQGVFRTANADTAHGCCSWEEQVSQEGICSSCRAALGYHLMHLLSRLHMKKEGMHGAMAGRT